MTPSNFAVSHARAAGLLYVVIILCGVGSEALVRGPLLAAGDGGSIARELLAVQTAFRLSIFADVVMALSDVALGVLLFFLFEPFDRLLSMMAMAFRLVQAAILGSNLLELHRALALSGVEGLENHDAWITTFFEGHGVGYDLGLFFFAINCVLVGVLVVRSGLLPRVLGWGLLASGVVYFAGSTARIVAPSVAEPLAMAYVIPLVAETAVCGWLLVRAADVVRRRRGMLRILDPR